MFRSKIYWVVDFGESEAVYFVRAEQVPKSNIRFDFYIEVVNESMHTITLNFSMFSILSIFFAFVNVL